MSLTMRRLEASALAITEPYGTFSLSCFHIGSLMTWWRWRFCCLIEARMSLNVLFPRIVKVRKSDFWYSGRTPSRPTCYLHLLLLSLIVMNFYNIFKVLTQSVVFISFSCLLALSPFCHTHMQDQGHNTINTIL